MVEGKDLPPELGESFHEGSHGKIGSLLLRMCEPAFRSSKSIILCSVFCVSKTIISLMSYVICSSSLIKKRSHWTNHANGSV